MIIHEIVDKIRYKLVELPQGSPRIAVYRVTPLPGVVEEAQPAQLIGYLDWTGWWPGYYLVVGLEHLGAQLLVTALRMLIEDGQYTLP